MPRNVFHVQVLVTQRCNAVCLHCDKAVGLARLSDIEMTEVKMSEFVDRILYEKFNVVRLSLSGGEPVVNKELQGIINQAARIPTLHICRVLTNALQSTQEKRDAIQFPDDRFIWNPSPLDDTTDPKSGKNTRGVRYRNHIHVPFFVSPADLGLEAKFENCTVKNFCGKGLDNNGWSMCGQAPILGRILGIDPYPKHGTIKQKVRTPIEEICRHCIYGMDLNKTEKKRLLLSHQDNPISPTFRKAFERPPAVYSLSHAKVTANGT